MPFLFLFFGKITGQTEPRLVKKITEEYVDDLEIYIERKHELYEYDGRGNEIFYTTIRFDDDGDYESWRQTKSDYNERGLLEKETFRRYNWDVKIWVNERWKEYEYDNDGCLVEEHFIENQASVNKFFLVFQNDDNCFPQIAKNYRIEDDSIAWIGEEERQYDLEGNLLYSSSVNWGQGGSNIDTFFQMLEQTFNDQNDLTSWVSTLNFALNGNNLSSFISTRLFDYEYEFENSFLISKKQTQRRVSSPNSQNQDTLVSNISDSKYEYTCDGLILKEDKSSDRFDFMGNFLSTRILKIHYVYEGEDACFDFENKFTATIYPNPTSGNFQIESPLLASGNTQVRVIDINGKILLEKLVRAREEKTSLDVEHLSNGTYFLQLWSGEHFVNKKLVIVK